MYFELLNRCLLGDDIACKELFIRWYLTTKMDILVNRLNLEQPLTIYPNLEAVKSNLQLGKILGEKTILESLTPKFINHYYIKNEIQEVVLIQLQQELYVLLEEIEKDFKSLKNFES